MSSTGVQIPINEVVTTIADLRPMQVVGTRILEVTEGEQFSAHELAQVISADQALTAKMLRVANSAYYSYPRRISTVRDAVVILGFRAVRSATLASCVMDTLTETTLLNGEDFWRFSVTVGTLSEARARATKTHQPDEAFTAGVIHNIGLLVLDQHLPHQLGETMKFASSEQCSLEAAEREVLGFTDAELGSALLKHWDFPESLVDAVSDVSESVEIVPDGSLAQHVRQARSFARSMGLADGIAPHEESPPDIEWGYQPLARELHRIGGPEGVLERTDAFLEATQQ
ncbi:MAG TPA: HDOD domain-containing protein [Dehalococcoidia bacterium]|nr:HDOD domain-containing protein [Dehalococcoidia bacterium]